MWGSSNLEGAIFDLSTFAGSEAAENGGGYPLDDPAVAAELRAIGIGLVSQANNHGTDGHRRHVGVRGRVLENAGLVHAGSGMSAAAARAGSVLYLPKGAVALVATASTYTNMSVGRPSGGANTRPPGHQRVA